jgi:hypothetical protein
MGEAQTSERIEEYWDWVAVALFLLLSVDLMTSIFAAGIVGLQFESNPLMRWLLSQSVVVIIAVHVGAGVLAATFFHGLFLLIEETAQPQRRVLSVMVELYLGVLIAVGLFVFANNLSVLVLGQSLV